MHIKQVKNYKIALQFTVFCEMVSGGFAFCF
jgi:hypothetical protein